MLPKVPANVSLHPGWFENTLPEFLALTAGEVAFAHIDCDIYSSTRTVLDALAPRLAPYAVLVFDEYFNYPNWQAHEFKAFQEFLVRHQVEYRYLGFCEKNGQVAVRLERRVANSGALR